MKFLGAIPAALYAFVLRIRHWLYDIGIFKRYEADIPVVCVGNITVGGTGKTPTVEYLIERLTQNFKPAVLSRGYGRRTKGYLEVTIGSSFLDVGDEPKQIKRKFPDTVVVVCENREEGIKRIREEHPEINLILLDDGFQHRSVTPKVNIVLIDYTRPIWDDHMLPWGNLRDLPSQLHRAHIVLVTKTPEGLTPIDRRIAVKSLHLFPYQKLFFTSMKQTGLIPMFPEAENPVTPGRNAAIMAAIGNPAALENSLSERFDIKAKWLFRDHRAYKVRDLQQIEQQLSALPEDTIIITTEKDAVKLANRKKIPTELQRRLYKMPIKLHFPERDEEVFVSTLMRNISSTDN